MFLYVYNKTPCRNYISIITVNREKMPDCENVGAVGSTLVIIMKLQRNDKFTPTCLALHSAFIINRRISWVGLSLHMIYFYYHILWELLFVSYWRFSQSCKEFTLENVKIKEKWINAKSMFWRVIDSIKKHFVFLQSGILWFSWKKNGSLLANLSGVIFI